MEGKKPSLIHVSSKKPSTVPSELNLICIQWKETDTAEYVNKLHASVARNCSKKNLNFYCLTANSSGLNEKIKIIPLLEDWKGWWGKATLFSKCTPLLFPSISFPQGSPPIQLRVLSSAECLH
jgi:hypothetical protein